MHIFILQHGLCDTNSHYLGEAQGWRRAIQQRGLTFELFIHRDATAEIIAQSGGAPTFPYKPLMEIRHDPVSDELHGNLLFAEAFRRACAVLTDKVKADDLVIIPHATAREIYGVSGWLRTLSAERRPKTAFVFINPNLNWAPKEDGSGVSGDFSFIRFAANQMSEVAPKERVIYCADNDRLATTMSDAMNQVCRHSPMTMDYETANTEQSSAPGTPPFPHAHIAVLGDTRLEKGSTIIVEIIQRYCEARPDQPVFLQVQNLEEAKRVGEALRDCGNNGVQLYAGRLSATAYHQRLETVDILLLPYQQDRYVMRSSGIFAEAVAYGLVTVAPAGTWMADQLAAGWGAGETYSEPSVEAIASALVQASDNCATLKEAATGRREEWRRRQSTLALLDHILSRAEPSA